MLGLVPMNRRKQDVLMSDFNNFDNMLGDFFDDGLWGKKNLLAETFRIDVQENDDDYVVEAELPGISKEEIEVKIDRGRLQISIEKDESSEEIKKNYIHRERKHSSLNRSIYLADALENGIVAKLDNGVLNLTIPKKQKEDRSRKIEIL
ncbi:Hsp20/alpha crystallin family protein [Proteocatella sphenisci]|uniref:Hsp20/alpha crystallin family protein n=1 Tax=Proteocatella sphenisci TaxID=181070 RepID=UPI00048FE86C|nr:Hsp20/alpha crystallin family protein [Proteocatella sphenisci]